MKEITERTPITGWDNIRKTFRELGFGDVDFGPEFERIYQDFHWVLMPHPVAVKRFYAIPPKEELLTTPWDSWYFMNNEPVHHVHYAQRKNADWSEWIQPAAVPECPEELVGIQWYWYNESQITPSLLINKTK